MKIGHGHCIHGFVLYWQVMEKQIIFTTVKHLRFSNNSLSNLHWQWLFTTWPWPWVLIFCRPICPRLCEIEQLWYRKRLKGQLKIKHSVGCTPFDLWKGTWMFLEERETLQVLNPPPEPISPRYLMVRVLLYIMWSFKARGHSKTPYILFLLETTLIQHRLRDLNITHEYLRWWRTLLYLLILSRGIKWAT